ncbi:MAG TPA: DUF1501 domain-containing protein [Thermoanaerobaculia bacterium]|jgi:hypothetical protein|nr:DUF1501 domain-containing protein [Thermoanaerobaculia bacterium]
MAKARHSKSTTECTTCSNKSGFPLEGEGFSRRRFMQVAGTGLVASYFADVFSPRLLYGATTQAGVFLQNKAKNCIFIFLPGAPSNIDTWDLKEGAWTPSDFAPTSYDNNNVRFPQGLLPMTAAQLGRVSFVRSGLSWAAVHTLGQAWAQIARNPGGATGSIAPHMGAVVALESQIKRAPSDVLPGFIALNSAGIPASGYFPASYAPFQVIPAATGLPTIAHPDGVSRFTDRWTFLQQLDSNRTTGALGKATTDMEDFYTQSKALMDAPNINAVFSFSPTEHTKYGATSFGDSLVVARNLVAAGKGTRFVQATLGGWDHHSGIYTKPANGVNSLYTQCAQFDPAYASLLADLQSMPGSVAGKTLLDETLVVVVAEFGRTVGALNNQNGRDHNLRMSTVWAGGGVRGAQVIGTTDATGGKVTDYGWSGNRDIRPEDVTSTIYSALGIDYTTVRHDDPLNRGFEYAPPFSDGTRPKPIDELF